MSDLSLDDVRKVAELANLTFSPDELVQMQGDMRAILDYVDVLQQVDTADVEPLAHPIEVQNAFRDDTPTEMLTLERALQNAPKTDGRYFIVPAILDAAE
ncbi:Asp-tRNA(Asn)/Glu-tRNA(Gln) amidotransferase subunit GatC [Rubinisphaera margarita]|uniref:Asp-tRNA(Asn)/Glu-tRNA(Gln) amidotransferase subunit GatC n=1 Tax=Rubinisphaera margarita TaxID=2909586 RepID=UPI001EE7C7DA|nr:Asp-tRNA(Asn)/Glu-tRNA(Gln) amidotransferase subunit GatC [Rubinisphaera margarita]MCG6157967.1 Asp-tRNA(Asn)/Glu-tRNA(Gln) amidotransferase subunit GatC [Rubinisphaera margarita]